MVLNDAGVIGLSLNGKSFPATAPIVANNGDWILVHYFNEGFQIHPMHLHGLPGMVVAKDGFAFPALHGGHRAGGTGGALQRVDPRRPPGTWASPKSRWNQALRP
jgi:FtsP/CotA-like multicopper oxidase with cupredoxin domain